MTRRWSTSLAISSLAATLGCGAKTSLRVPDAVLDVAPRGDGSADAPDAPDSELDAALIAQLDGLRWELPCGPAVSETVCQTAGTRRVEAVLAGPPGAGYRVTARFRGVVELKSFVGGAPRDEHWQIGGTPALDSWNVYALEVSAPAARFYVNRGPPGQLVCVALDYIEQFDVDVGARVVLTADSVNALEVRNVDARGAAIVVPGVPPSPRPFDGQFIQMDVVAVARMR